MESTHPLRMLSLILFNYLKMYTATLTSRILESGSVKCTSLNTPILKCSEIYVFPREMSRGLEEWL